MLEKVAAVSGRATVPPVTVSPADTGLVLCQPLIQNELKDIKKDTSVAVNKRTERRKRWPHAPSDRSARAGPASPARRAGPSAGRAVGQSCDA